MKPGLQAFRVAATVGVDSWSAVASCLLPVRVVGNRFTLMFGSCGLSWCTTRQMRTALSQSSASLMIQVTFVANNKIRLVIVDRKHAANAELFAFLSEMIRTEKTRLCLTTNECSNGLMVLNAASCKTCLGLKICDTSVRRVKADRHVLSFMNVGSCANALTSDGLVSTKQSHPVVDFLHSHGAKRHLNFKSATVARRGRQVSHGGENGIGSDGRHHFV